MVQDVGDDGYEIKKGYEGFEAGTPDISAGIGLGAAVDYLTRVGVEAIHHHEQRLTAKLLEGLQEIDGVEVYGPVSGAAAVRGGVVALLDMPNNPVPPNTPERRAAKQRLARRAPVDILVAIPGEPKSYLMPDLVGRDFPFVKDRLERLGFNVVHAVSRKRGEGKFPNAILSQAPPAGAKIKEGDTIELVVSALE